MQRRGVVWMGIGAAVLLAACTHRRPTVEAARPPVWFIPAQACAAQVGTVVPPLRATDTLSAAYASRFSQAAEAYAARRVAGGYNSGPMPTAQKGRALLVLRDTSAGRDVLVALRQLPGFSLRADIAPDSVTMRVAEWDAAALYDWMHYIMDQRGPRGISGWGIEQGHIRLDLGDVESVPALVGHLEQLGVPCALVKFAVTGHFVTTSR